jgi:hypothetical protein
VSVWKVVIHAPLTNFKAASLMRIGKQNIRKEDFNQGNVLIQKTDSPVMQYISQYISTS